LTWFGLIFVRSGRSGGGGGTIMLKKGNKRRKTRGCPDFRKRSKTTKGFRDQRSFKKRRKRLKLEKDQEKKGDSRYWGAA